MSIIEPGSTSDSEDLVPDVPRADSGNHDPDRTDYEVVDDSTASGSETSGGHLAHGVNAAHGAGEPDAARGDHLPGLAYHFFTPWYDLVAGYTLPERVLKSRLVEQAGIEPQHVVLDLGCGTGTLLLQIKRAQPEANVHGLDADATILGMARKKIDAEACDISLHRAPASSIPLPDGSVDRVLSSLFFHHLDRAEKIEALRESIRILGKDGELHIADWGLPHDPLMRLAFYMVQFFDGFKSTRDHVDGKLPEIIREAGFADVKETTRFRSVFGSLSLYSARKLPRSA